MREKCLLWRDAVAQTQSQKQLQALAAETVAVPHPVLEQEPNRQFP
jgi:hypothetical protein